MNSHMLAGLQVVLLLLLQPPLLPVTPLLLPQLLLQLALLL